MLTADIADTASETPRAETRRPLPRERFRRISRNALSPRRTNRLTTPVSTGEGNRGGGAGRYRSHLGRSCCSAPRQAVTSTWITPLRDDR